MKKDLHQMNSDELGQLFPIFHTEHNPQWSQLYEQEKNLILHFVGETCIIKIHHIGSTAVSDLIAKPIIDILLEIKEGSNVESVIKAFQNNGYNYIPVPNNPPPHLMFVKGYTLEGFKGQTYHVHARFAGDWDEPYFRDYLIDHPKIASEYAALKIRLQKIFEHDRDGYTEAKTDFITRYTGVAKQLYRSKYDQHLIL